MYEKFYGLREKPFALTPDPHFLYFGRHHQRALLQLEYGLANQAAFLLITGEVGAGKTTLIRYLLGRLAKDLTVGLISNTSRDTGRLLQWVCSAYGLDIAGKDDVALYNSFIEFAIEEYASGRRVVLIVDEAQNLGRNKLEELRVLSNVNVDKYLVLQTILVGQPELRDMMRTPAAAAVRPAHRGRLPHRHADRRRDAPLCTAPPRSGWCQPARHHQRRSATAGARLEPRRSPSGKPAVRHGAGVRLRGSARCHRRCLDGRSHPRPVCRRNLSRSESRVRETCGDRPA